MQPKQFKGANVVFAKDQPQYNQLPAYREDSPEGRVITCWELSDWDIQKIIERKEIWVQLMTFNNPLHPISISVMPMIAPNGEEEE